MPLQQLRPNVRKHWFPEVNRHILTIVLVEALVIMWRRLLELNFQCFTYFPLKFSPRVSSLSSRIRLCKYLRSRKRLLCLIFYL